MAELHDLEEPTITHLGKELGIKSVYALSSEEEATSWAAGRGRVVWPVMEIVLGEAYIGRTIPAQKELVLLPPKVEK